MMLAHEHPIKHACITPPLKVSVAVTVQAELAQDEREAAELAGVTWHPEISKMAQTLQRRDADEDSFMRLTRTRTNKTQVGPDYVHISIHIPIYKPYD